ncbi:divalent-cation tolerance protein CutA [Jiangella rhizosphaerae]|uniref:Divalent-cation tolerance protein CutA n=1 Tax=Jiangella rhizosphaerae TaxID=2293569 RepID=A0A418KI77_9ACTN|nr:divalent-cation tolerance protein CutA [Jiangella rhizosphaerae]RIQ12385.1 divalent-cation tolerance protein CutA [Jiangella rhizosphaerae]
MASDHVIVTTTVDGEAAARELAAGVVAARLGACAQIVPITSVYRWEGAVRTEPEWRVEIKTTAARAEAVVAHLSQVHPYDVPEVVVTPIAGGSDAYLAWVSAETG